MKKLAFYLCIGITGVAFAPRAEARYSEKIARQIEEQIDIMEASFHRKGDSEKDDQIRFPNFADPNNPNHMWYLGGIWLRLRPYVGFHVPLLTHLKVVPEVELLWTQSWLQDWEPYHP